MGFNGYEERLGSMHQSAALGWVNLTHILILTERHQYGSVAEVVEETQAMKHH